MFNPGDIILVKFPGAITTKLRPSVIVSSNLYHQYRPDIIVGVLTTNLKQASAPTDYILIDWSKAGLHYPSAFRSYLLTIDPYSVTYVGRLTERDRQGVLASLKRALIISDF